MGVSAEAWSAEIGEEDDVECGRVKDFVDIGVFDSLVFSCCLPALGDQSGELGDYDSVFAVVSGTTRAVGVE